MDKFFLNTINAFGSMSKMFSDLDKTLNDFMVENQKMLQVTNKGKCLYNNIKKEIKDVYETMSDLKVKIPYDKDKDVISYTINDGLFKVEVVSKDASMKNTISTTLPENINIDKMEEKYDEEMKVMTYIIPKIKDIKYIKNEKIRDAIADFKEKNESLKKQLKEKIETIKNSDVLAEDKITNKVKKGKKFVSKIIDSKFNVKK